MCDNNSLLSAMLLRIQVCRLISGGNQAICPLSCVCCLMRCFCAVQEGYTQFTPHFMVQRCLDSSNSQTCQDNCINHGRYCAMDSIPETLQSRYKGHQVCADDAIMWSYVCTGCQSFQSLQMCSLFHLCLQVVEENKRQLCIRQQAEAKQQTWLWWTYVQHFNLHCKYALSLVLLLLSCYSI